MNYTELVNTAKLYADRQDVEVDSQIDIFISLAEARINRLLRTREQSKRAFTKVTDNQEYYSLPPDYSGMRSIRINSPSGSSTSRSYKMLTPELFDIERGRPFSGEYFYCIISNQFQIYPVESGNKDIELTYYQKVPNIAPDATNNWLSDEHPDIYVSGVVAEIELFVKNYEVAKLWHDRMSLAIDELDNLDFVERWSGTPMETRVG